MQALSNNVTCATTFGDDLWSLWLNIWSER